MTISDEKTADGAAPRAVRPRDAAASKRALLQAAQDLFGHKGFERTTIRDIGERAGVDAALIARYFGSKSDLYVAAVAAEDAGEQRPRPHEGLEEMADAMVSRADDHGPGPIMQAIIRSDTSEEIRTAALHRITCRLVDPLVAEMTDRQVDQAELRAEIAVSAMLGISLARSLGWFNEVHSVPKDELVAFIAEALQEVTGKAPPAQRGDSSFSSTT
jgi:AcrR family transcriptional regulator